MSAWNIAVSQLLFECYELVALLLEYIFVIEEMSLEAPSSTSISVVSCVSMNAFMFVFSRILISYFLTKVIKSCTVLNRILGGI